MGSVRAALGSPETTGPLEESWRPKTAANDPAPPSIESQLVNAKERDEAEPSYVTIDEEKYYGGMQTVHHPLLSTQVCHILNACMRHDGTLVLPKWMRRHDLVLTRTCGIRRVEFTLPDRKPPSEEPMDRVDLFGLHVPHHHMPTFLVDFLQAIISFDTVFGDHVLTRSCFTRAGKDCRDFPDIARKSLRPGVFLDPRAKLVEERSSWVRQLVRLATPKNSPAKTRTLFWSDAFPRGERSGMKCVRSAYTLRASSNRLLVDAGLFEKLRLFADSRVDKAARTRRMDGERCALNVTFVNRKPIADSPDRLLGRYIPNIPVIREELQRMAGEAGDMNLNVNAVRMEGRSIRWQINAMQKTDVLVAGHGSALTNMVFMRSRSSVLELQPFAYYPTTYEEIAMRVANLRYDSFVARPDGEAFHACMAHFYRPGHRDFERAANVLRRYDKATGDYAKSEKNTHSLTLHNLDASMGNVRVCAEMQQLATNPSQIAKTIFGLARAGCGYQRR